VSGVAIGLADAIGDDHAFEDVAHFAFGVFEVAEGGEAAGAADEADEHGGFREGEFFGGFFEVVAAGLFEAVGAGAEVDEVDVGFEDLVLAVEVFDAS